jgi:uncharacterized protein (TIGR02001 family)
MFQKVTMLACAVAAVPFLPGAAAADEEALTTTANVGVFSQYVFRGITQTDEDPALQGGFDAAHSSGFYAGLWGSNISWISDFGSSDGGNSLELDVYGGYRGTFGDSELGYDVGLLYYWYPGDTTGGFDPDTIELYGGLTYKWAGLKLYYSLDDYFGFEGDTGDNGSDGTIYYDLSANIPVGESGVTVNLHYGYLDVENDLPSSSELSYADWKVGASYALPRNFTVGAFLTGTDAEPVFYTTPAGKDTSDDQFVAFLSRTF